MGGFGSGTKWQRKGTVEDCLTIRMKRLRRMGLLDGRCHSTLGWASECGAAESSVQVEVVTDEPLPFVRLKYRETDWAGQRLNRDYSVGLNSAPCRFGGRQWYFRCVGCGRRVRQIHLPPGGNVFACRHCYDLAYVSTQAGSAALSSLMRLYRP